MIKINYTLDNNNVITGYTIVPFDTSKPYIEIENPNLINIGYSQIINGEFFSNNDLYLSVVEAKKELKEILAWFKETDYYPNKIITGEWSSDCAKWVNYLSERAIKRQRYDELMGVINNV